VSEREHERLGAWRLAGQAGDGRARGILRLWVAYEWLWLRFHRVYPIPGAEGGLFRVQFWRYRGRPIELPDGTRVSRGDRVAILHIQNHELARLAEQARTWSALRLMSLDLRELAAWAKAPDFPPGVRALFGVTMIGRGAPRLGFTVRPRARSLMAWLERHFLLGILLLYHAHGVERLLEGSVRETPLVEVWMSLSELERRYGARASTE
jgi:peptidoglycan-N-acetylglucosamine deacetylase